jgi:putative ATP-dependent endonuclease of OLD family
MHGEAGLENLVFKNTPQAALERFAKSLDWPQHLKAKYPDLTKNTADALSEYFKGTKGNWGLAEYLAQCSETEIPSWIRESCIALAGHCQPAGEAGPAKGA